MRSEQTNASLIGIVSVLVWGASLPVTKMLMMNLGIFAVMGGLQAFCAVLGLLKQKYVLKKRYDKKIFRNPLFYARWGFFVLHLSGIFLANYLVSKENISLVILLNYFWPTAIILFSILIAGVKITRIPPFIFGIFLVLVSLTIELMGPHALSISLFENKTDILAYVIAFIGSIFWGLYSAISRKTGDSTGGGMAIPLFQLSLALMLPISFLPGVSSWGNLDTRLAVIFFFYGLLQFAAYACWDHGMRKGNIIFLSLCADFMPWISLASAYVVLGTHIGITTVLSGVLLVLGAMTTRYGTLTKKPALAIPAPE